jgi:hypothetical protein
LHLILGGAAVYRCDNWRIFGTGFSRCGQTAARKTLFPLLPLINLGEVCATPPISQIQSPPAPPQSASFDP